MAMDCSRRTEIAKLPGHIHVIIIHARVCIVHLINSLVFGVYTFYIRTYNHAYMHTPVHVFVH